MAWQYAHIGFEQDGFRISGTDVWKAEWKRVEGECVELPHPSYADQMHRFNVYEIETSKGSVRIAFTELSAGVYGFYRWANDR